MSSPQPGGPRLLDQASCLALGHSLLILLLGDLLLLDVPRVGDAVNGPAGEEPEVCAGQAPSQAQSQQPWGHSQGEVGDEGCLGQLHIKRHLLGGVCTIDSPRGDNIVSKAGGHLATDLGTVDLNAFDHLWEKGRGHSSDQPA